MFELAHEEFKKGNTIPESLEQILFTFYKQKDKQNLKSTLQMFKGSAVNYSKIATEYSLYYFPVNIFKIWKALIDLAERKQLKNQMEILEIGCGPGSSSFGVMEFYRFMALEQPNTKFSLTFTLIEQYKEFFEIFEQFFESYKITLPANLSIDIKQKLTDIVKEKISPSFKTKFNLIIASNVFNSNETNGTKHFKILMTNLKNYIQNDGSIIIIEPAEETNSIPFLQLRNQLQNEKILNIYSPCNCMYSIHHNLCCAFSMARVYIAKSIMLLKLKKDGIITNNNPFVHNFQYAVFRKDGLQKYDIIRKKHVKLCDIAKQEIGSRVNIYAQIVTTAPNKDFLHICDGTLTEKGKVIIKISDLKSHGIDENFIRGEKIVLQDAIVQASNKLSIDSKTKVEVNF